MTHIPLLSSRLQSMFMSSSSPSSSSSSNTTTPKWIHQVFFSFTKEDVVVKRLVVTLNARLGMTGIRTCFDHIHTVRKEHEESSLPSQLLQAIEGSRVSIVVFSEKYAGSSWCLQELEKIMECHRAKGQMVLPVFCGVHFWEVRKQKGKFGELFERMIKRTSVKENTQLSWRRAMAEAAFFPGCFLPSYSSSDTISDCDAFNEVDKEVGNIVEIVRMMVDDKYLSGPRHPVGIDVDIKHVIDSLSNNFERVHLVGIWGLGGSGKTTIAKVIYNSMCHSFEGSSFLSDIGNVWGQDNGKDCLQKQLLSDINNTTGMIIHNTEMEKIFSHKRVLVVLDEVWNEDQVNMLCGSREWFGLGSIILITTRYKHLLHILEMDIVHKMRGMNVHSSLELLSWHAFKNCSPTVDFIELSREAINYCGGLPLALEVLGSFFLERTTSEWRNALQLLERNRSDWERLKMLKLSYEALDDNEKQIFREIACFYVGNDRHSITQFLNGCGLAAETGISKLIERSLLKVDKNNKLEMHNVLQDMGKEMNRFKPKSKWIHDVFLSFRGEDTRRSVTSNLHATLQNAGIDVYMDDDKLERGEDISNSLLQAIEKSRISIIIFSKNYANSRWCLQELEKIMECHRTIGQQVLPVFYGVEPSEVRNRFGSFGKEFEGLVQRISATKEMIIIWKRALTEAANLSGWNFNNYRTEIELIGDILKTVTTKLDDGTYLFVADHPVGVESRVQDMIQLFSVKSNEVRIVGILGMPGSGKTTIAKAVYNEINQKFEGKSFLASIRDVWDQASGQVYLQKQLLSDILKTTRSEFHNIDLGRTIIEERLCKKRVLIVLDDINDLGQLNALCGSRKWFGQGSRIIITTRDEHLLKVLQVDNIFKMKEMDGSESLELFSWHAFKQAAPIADFIGPSRRVVAYSGRLPLALEVLGSYLFERKIAEWESALSKLEIIPNDQIQKKLKLSYDGLSDDKEKHIFLDICCFFIGKDRNYVTQILDDCDLGAEIGITVLIDRSLVKVDKNNKLEMHDLLKLMGREIIREMSPEEPEKRSRLCVQDEVVEVMKYNIATIAIKGLAFNLPKNNDVIFETKAFKKMKRLRLLQLSHVKLNGDFEYLSKDLRWLCWHGCPLRYMPGNFNLEKVVAIDLKYSNLKLVWKEPQLLDKLKILNLSHSHYFTQTPDFSKLPNLEKLMLKDCPKLLKIHSNIGDLKYLILVNLKDCKSLSHLPRSIYKLKSVKSLVLSGCSKIDKLEEDILQMEALTSLVAENTAITKVPHSLVRSKSIKYVSLCGYEGLSRDVFPSIIRSSMSPTSNPRYNVFGSISSSLQSLSLGLSAKNHEALELRPRAPQITDTETPTLIDFQNSIPITRTENCTSALVIYVGECSKATENISQGWTNDGSGECDYFPGDIYSKWLTFKGKGSSVLFKVPDTGCKLKGVTLRIIYSSSLVDLASEFDLLSVLIRNYTKNTFQSYKRDTTTSLNDEEWHGLMSNLESGDDVEVSIFSGRWFTVKETVVHLIYGELTDDKIVECSSAPAIPAIVCPDPQEKWDNEEDEPKEKGKALKKSTSTKDQPSKKKAMPTESGRRTRSKVSGSPASNGKALLKVKEEKLEKREEGEKKKKKGKQTKGAIKEMIEIDDNNPSEAKSPKDQGQSTTPPDSKMNEVSLVEQTEETIDELKHTSSSILPTFSREALEDPHFNLYIDKEVDPMDLVTTRLPPISLSMEVLVACSASTTPTSISPIPAFIAPPTHSIATTTTPLCPEEGTSKELIVATSSATSSPSQGSSEGNINEEDILGFDFDSFNVLLNEDLVAAIESLASGKISKSSKTQQSMNASESIEVDSSKVILVVEQLKNVIFEPNFFQSLSEDSKVQEILNLVEQIKHNINQVPEPTRLTIEEFEGFICRTLGDFSSLDEWSKSYDKANQSKDETIEKMRNKQIELNKTKIAIETVESKLKTQVETIAQLEEQLATAHKAHKCLEDGMKLCQEKRKTTVKDYKDLAGQTMSVFVSMLEADNKKKHFDKELKQKATEFKDLKKKFS